MNINDLLKIKDSILIVTGEFASTFDDSCLSYHPECAEGEDNRPKAVVKRIEEYCKTHQTGIVITHSPFVFEAFELYGKKYGVNVRFFIWGDGPCDDPDFYDEDLDIDAMELTECTDNTSVLYDITVQALSVLKTERYDQENS